MNLCVVICTISRPDDLNLTLSFLLPQIESPDSVLIVDGGNVTDIEKIQKTFAGKPIYYLHPGTTSNGLTWSRNNAIENLPEGTDLVLFIDDDVTLDPNYISTMKKLFEEDPLLSGASGFIRSKYYVRPWYKKLGLVSLGLVLHKKVSASFLYPVMRRGWPIYPVFKLDKWEGIRAEWLSGCNMMYRREVFDSGHRFDKNLVGYCLWEDVNFSNGLFLEGHKLVMSYRAQLVHRAEWGRENE